MGQNIPFDAMKNLYPAVGSLVITWGYVETALEGCVAAIYHKAGGKAHIETTTLGIPRVWARKRSFLRRCFRQIHDLAPLAADAAVLLDRVAAVEKVRNQVVHGAVSEYDRAKQRFKFVGLQIDQVADIHVETPIWISAAEIMAATGNCVSLAHDLADFALRLIEAIVPEHERGNLSRRIII